MRRRVLLLWACLAFVASGQQGHPLTGTWAGDWGPTATQRNAITVVMNWDGKNITGLLNPGPDSTPLASVFLDVSNWTVRIQADGKDKAGATVHITAEGRIDDLASYHRTII